MRPTGRREGNAPRLANPLPNFRSPGGPKSSRAPSGELYVNDPCPERSIEPLTFLEAIKGLLTKLYVSF